MNTVNSTNNGLLQQLNHMTDQYIELFVSYTPFNYIFSTDIRPAAITFVTKNDSTKIAETQW